VTQPLSDDAVLQAVVRGKLLSPEQLWKALEARQGRSLREALREQGLEDDGPLYAYMPTAAPIPRAGAADTAPSTAPQGLDLSRRLGKFALLEKLGEGGMGEVWKAWQLDLGRTVAVKLLLRISESDIARFRREAKLTASLVHPNIASVYEVGEEAGRPYLAMEYVAGQTLDRARLPLRRALEAMRDAAEAVHHAHLRGVVHRDLKPSNIMMDPSGKVYVMDFGLARGAREGPGPSLTLTGELLGTPAYMAPEQARGLLHLLGPRTDVWGLGATLYQLVTGRPPFEGANLGELLERVVGSEVLPPGRLAPGVGRDVDTVVRKCLEKDPFLRYGSAGELAADLDRVLRGDPLLARRPGLLERAGRRIRRAPGLYVLLAFLVGVGGPGSALFLSGRPDPLSGLRAQLRAAQEVGDFAKVTSLYDELQRLDPGDSSLSYEQRRARDRAEQQERKASAADLMRAVREYDSDLHAGVLLGAAMAQDPGSREVRHRLGTLLQPGPARDRLMGPAPRESRLIVRTDPVDAKVQVIPTPPRPPPVLPYLEPFFYSIRVSAPGRSDAWFSVFLEEMESLEVQCSLPSGPAPAGYYFVSDGRKGGVFLSLAPVTWWEADAFRRSQGKTGISSGVQKAVQLDWGEANAYAAWKGTRLPTAAELLAASGPGHPRARIVSEWAAGSEPTVYQTHGSRRAQPNERLAFRLVAATP